MLFVLRGSVVPVILPQLLFATAIATVVTVLHGQIFQWKIPLNVLSFSLIGLTMAIFLGFRNNTSYARYWEARTLWGAILNGTRSLLRQGLTHVDTPDHSRSLGLILMAFVHALRHQLRGSDPSADLGRLLPADACTRLAPVRFKPAVLLLMAGEWIAERRREGTIEPMIVPALEVPLGKLSEALGGCERIASTPIPFAYAVIIHRTIYFYCLLLPFALVDTIGWMTPLITAFVVYTFFALEALGAEIEEPFGTAPNDLALDAISRMIESTLREMLGETLPPPQDTTVDFIET
jgi:putative membrane protein